MFWRMKHTEDIILRLLRIRRARALSERHDMSAENVQILRDFILENRRQVPSFALLHFDRLEASGKRGVAVVKDGRCSFCSTPLPPDELDYLEKNRNIGVCDKCYAFLYMPDARFEPDDFFEKLLLS